jgi:hypothetical protein
MKRRDLMAVLGGAALTAPPHARAQQKPMRVVGQLNPLSPPRLKQQPFGSHTLKRFVRGCVKTVTWKGKTSRLNGASPRVIMIDCPRWPPISSTVRLM